jgi:predicted metal-dependent enzyme (double-stranded beta helix superfamily)
MTPHPFPALPGRRSGDGRLSTPRELVGLAAEVAARRELWEPLLDARATVRTYASLHREPELEVWAIAWLPDNDTGWHDHEASSGAVRVVEGSLEEHVLRVGGADRRTLHRAGDAFTFGPDHIHRVTCPAGRALSIHVYSPALWRLGQYTVDEDGVLHRLTISYADELRPLDARAVAAR